MAVMEQGLLFWRGAVAALALLRHLLLAKRGADIWYRWFVDFCSNIPRISGGFGGWGLRYRPAATASARDRDPWGVVVAGLEAVENLRLG